MIVALQAMSADRVAEWIGSNRADYIRELIEHGSTPEAAAANAAISFDDNFPDGQPAENHLIFDVTVDGERVGFIWVGPREATDVSRWWVWDIAIVEAERGKGFAKAALGLIEPIVKARGASMIGLSVFGDNTAARKLYESVGYETRAVQMVKPLP